MSFRKTVLLFLYALLLITIRPLQGFTQSTTPVSSGQVNVTDGSGGWALQPYSGSSGNFVATRNVLGTILNQSTFTSLTGFTPNGTTPTVSGGQLQFSGGTGTETASLDYNYFTTLTNWSETINMVAGTVTSSSYGLALGVRSAEVNGGFDQAFAGFGMATGAAAGFVSIYSGSAQGGATPPIVATSTSALSFSAGDTIQLSVALNYNVMTATVSDLTTASAPVTVSYTFLFTYLQTAFPPNIGKFAIYNFGGSQNVSSWSITSTTQKNAQVAFIGDSKTVGYYAGTYGNAFALAMQANLNDIIEAGGNDATGDVLLNLPEIISLHPQAVVLNIGRNDLCEYSISLGTIEANYASIVSQLQAANITVYHLLPIYETACNQASLTSYITSTYTSVNQITSTLAAYAGTGSNVLAGDGIHPNALGHQLIYNALFSFFQALNATNLLFNPYVSPVATSTIQTGVTRIIQTQTLASTGNSVTFTIPAGFTNLHIYMSASNTSGSSASIQMQFNGDTGADYSDELLYATGTTPAAVGQASQTSLFVGSSAGGSGISGATNIVDIVAYSNTAMQKSYASRSSVPLTTTTAQVSQVGGFWSSTAAITSITILSQSGTSFAAGSTFILSAE